MYSSAPIHFHVISDAGSLDVIGQIMKRAERQANCPFTYSVETIDNVFDELTEHLQTNVPHLKLPILQKHVITQMMPLVLAWHYSGLQRVIFINNRIKFRTDIVELYEHFDLMEEEQIMGLPLVQDARFASAFAVYRHLNANTKENQSNLGLSPPRGWPGFNTALMLLDCEKMRESYTLKRYIDLETQFPLIGQYEFKTRDLLPKLDEWVTLIATEKPELFYTLPCQWNVQPIMDSDAFEYCRADIKAMEFDS